MSPWRACCASDLFLPPLPQHFTQASPHRRLGNQEGGWVTVQSRETKSFPGLGTERRNGQSGAQKHSVTGWPRGIRGGEIEDHSQLLGLAICWDPGGAGVGVWFGRVCGRHDKTRGCRQSRRMSHHGARNPSPRFGSGLWRFEVISVEAASDPKGLHRDYPGSLNDSQPRGDQRASGDWVKRGGQLGLGKRAVSTEPREDHFSE